MAAACADNSTLGIPKSVGCEFVKADSSAAKARAKQKVRVKQTRTRARNR